MKWLLLALPLAFAAGCTTMRDRLSGARTVQEAAQAAADFYVADRGEDTCVVGVARGESGETVFACAGGADEHSLYRIASLSKMFLYKVLVTMNEEGRLALGRSVADCSSLALPPECANVTLRDLMENRSGLPREFLTLWDPSDVYSAFHCGFTGSHLYADFDSRDGFVRELWRPMWRKAMRKGGSEYSNMGFGLLGMAVEDALGRDLETLVAEELTGPLGMGDTTFSPQGDQTNRLTRACAGDLPWLVRRRHEVPDHRLGDALRAAGGLLSSASDCLAFFRSCWPLVDSLTKAHPLQSTPDGADVGLLRVRALPDGRRVLFRAGMIYGGASFVGYDPATRTVVVILRNVTSWPDRSAFDVMKRLSDVCGEDK